MSLSIKLRPSRSYDSAFLLKVYAATRARELSTVPWGDEEKDAFIRQQFEAQSRHFRQRFPGATELIVLANGKAAGRLYLNRTAEELRILDLGFLPEHHTPEVEEALVRQLMDDAERGGLRLCATIDVSYPARELYERLGFRRGEAIGTQFRMEWSAPSMASVR